MKKHIEVVAGIIIKDNKVFCAQRGYGFLKGKWEFPGGKVELGETEPQALKRELLEELSADIKVEKYFCTIDHEYEPFSITMICYLCSLLSPNLTINPEVHMSDDWVDKESILNKDWAEADYPIAKKLIDDKII